MLIRCAYCDWVGFEPNPAEFAEGPEGDKALSTAWLAFENSHAGCPGPEGTAD